jgi:hypothetical protein
MSLPDVPDGLPPGLHDLLQALKETVERLDGEQIKNDKAMTYDDAIDIGLIDKDFVKI